MLSSSKLRQTTTPPAQSNPLTSSSTFGGSGYHSSPQGLTPSSLSAATTTSHSTTASSLSSLYPSSAVTSTTPVDNATLIKKINQLQEVFADVGVVKNIDLPQIIVIGSQSSGKSSVLENIVGRDFLPRGTGIVTRRPLLLQLVHTKSKSSYEDANTATEEWGEFGHRAGKIYDFEEIKREIITETDAKCSRQGISPEPIILRIYSPHLLNLTLIDLPGLTKLPVGEQPKDIEAQIRNLIMKYIERPNSIILAVTAANTDLANSDGLKLARDVDPEGLRTIGVLTKVDLMDSGTDVIDILAGRIIPLRLGYVPVVNRSQRDIERKTTISVALDTEKTFFETHSSYKAKAKYCGTTFLANKLNTILIHHIRNTLPEIKHQVSMELSKCRHELMALGESGSLSPTEKQTIMLHLLGEFSTDFRTILDGNSIDLSSQELSGGARISFVFHEIFVNGINSIDPFDQVKDSEIRTMLYNCSGSTPSLFVGAAAFEAIVRNQIRRMREPSLRCVTLIYEELLRILQQVENKPDKKMLFKRYPQLLRAFHNTAVDFFKKAIAPTEKLVSDIIAAEACYINTAHPEFISGHKAFTLVEERAAAKQSGMDTKNQKTPTPSSTRSGNWLTSSSSEGGGSDGFFGSFFKPGKKSNVLESPPAKLVATGSFSEREVQETEVIKILIRSYFSIVKKNVADMIPKLIMLNLVNFCKDEMNRELMTQLYHGELLEELMQESEGTTLRRKEALARMQLLTRADDILSTV